MRSFSSLSEREILALAIALEEEDERVYADYAERLRPDFPASAAVLDGMRQDESEHRARLLDRYQHRFGDHVPLIRRQDVRGFVTRRSPWLVQALGPEMIRRQAAAAEVESRRFYERAAARTSDPETRKLLDDLAQIERSHEERADALEREHLTAGTREEEAAAQRRLFVLQVVQPGLAGLMDGSVSTLAPLFAAAFATHQNFQTFLVGLAASIGAGISMGFAEALSDDGSLTGRGSPWLRGVTCGLMTTVGGLGHTAPYLVPDSWANAFWIATVIASVVVFFELWAIAYIRARYMDTPFLQAVFQIVLGGVIVLAVGILIGAA